MEFRLNGIYYDKNPVNDTTYVCLGPKDQEAVYVKIIKGDKYKDSTCFLIEKCQDDIYLGQYTRLHEIIYGK